MRGQQPWKTNRARVLRSNATSAEDLLWHHLRARRLNGYKFVRQLPVDRYFADFACREANLVIEIDGATHASCAERVADQQRTERLMKLGWRILRFSNHDVRENLDGVLDEVERRLRDGPED